MKIGRLKITAYGWPWQTVGNHWANRLDETKGEKWGWNPFRLKGMGRFGGGWAFKFGITASSSLRDVIFDLGLGGLRFTVQAQKEAS